MTECEDRLFYYADLPLMAPWLTKETFQELTAAGLFAPRLTQPPEADMPHLSLFDLIAVTCVQQLFRCGITVDQLRRAVYDPSSFRCDDLYQDHIGFLNSEPIPGQELSRFLEIRNANVTILVRHFLESGTDIEFIPNELLGATDFRGVTLTGVECKTIRDAIKDNIAGSATRGPA